ncbi:hypothetical protein LCGC14_0823770 [marine sediment metagenome]|uniref:Uncharacterized protein n=1 Tax=marine sediment metagenome TaxID=412755 RepID=A0A0F9PMP7_9ZZZZ
MRIFNDEGKEADIIIIFKNKEIKKLLEALKEACSHRPRKKTWKKLADEIYTEAAIY